MRSSIFVSLSFAALAVGCSAAPPQGFPTGAADGGPVVGTQQPVVTPVQTPDMAGSNQPPQPPVLDAVPQTSVYTTVPVHGTAQPGSTVLITSDAGNVSVQVSEQGSFCKDVPLEANTTNHFSLTTIGTNNLQSTAITLDVTQNGTPQQAPTPDQSQDAAVGGTAKSQYIGYFGQNPDSVLNDGDTTTWVEGTYDPGWTFSNPKVYAMVTLVQPSRVNEIDAWAPTDCLFNVAPHVLYSASAAASSPTVSMTGWVEVKAQLVQGNTALQATFPQTIVGTIALYWDSSSQGCGLLSNVFGVAEMAAWTVPDAPPPPPAAPSCAGG